MTNTTLNAVTNALQAIVDIAKETAKTHLGFDNNKLAGFAGSKELVTAVIAGLALRTLRQKLPGERRAMTHIFALDGDAAELAEIARPAEDETERLTHRVKVKIYLIMGMYPDGRLGEIFLVADKQGSFVSGLLDAIATVVSIALQHNVPLTTILKKFRHTRFPPNNIVSGSAEITAASSILDYMAQYLERRFPNGMATTEMAVDFIAGERFGPEITGPIPSAELCASPAPLGDARCKLPRGHEGNCKDNEDNGWFGPKERERAE